MAAFAEGNRFPDKTHSIHLYYDSEEQTDDDEEVSLAATNRIRRATSSIAPSQAEHESSVERQRSTSAQRSQQSSTAGSNLTQFQKSTGTVLSTGKYMTKPGLRAEKVCQVCRYGNIHFIKGFWNLTESVAAQSMHSVLGPRLGTNRYFYLPRLPIVMKTESGTTRSIEAPQGADGQATQINVRLLSTRPILFADESHPPHASRSVASRLTQAMMAHLSPNAIAAPTAPITSNSNSDNNRKDSASGTAPIAAPSQVAQSLSRQLLVHVSITRV